MPRLRKYRFIYEIFKNYRYASFITNKFWKTLTVLGDLFDLNKDGKVDDFERTMEYDFLEKLSFEDKLDDDDD